MSWSPPYLVADPDLPRHHRMSTDKARRGPPPPPPKRGFELGVGRGGGGGGGAALCGCRRSAVVIVFGGAWLGHHLGRAKWPRIKLQFFQYRRHGSRAFPPRAARLLGQHTGLAHGVACILGPGRWCWPFCAHCGPLVRALRADGWSSTIDFSAASPSCLLVRSSASGCLALNLPGLTDSGLFWWRRRHGAQLSAYVAEILPLGHRRGPRRGSARRASSCCGSA